MLIMLKSSAFKSKEKIREPIYFHKGLNVVMGDDTGSNSIGKSTFLMILDFIFGGDDYIYKSTDTHDEVGVHSFEFTFKFGENEYNFSRSTGNFKIVTICKSNFEPIRDISIDDFNNFLLKNYHLNLPGLTFRNAVARFFRVYGRETLNENHPLKSAIRESDSAGIDGMLKLFNKYSMVVEQKELYEKAKDEEATFKKAKKYELIPYVSSKKSYEENEKRIAELEDKAKELAEESSEGLLEIDSIKAQELAEIRSSLSFYKRQKTVLLSQLKNAEQDKVYYKTTYLNDYSQLLEFFPDINIERLIKVESFHKELSKILNTEFKENEVNIRGLLEIAEANISNFENKIKEQKSIPNVTQAILKKYSTIQSELDKLRKANENFFKSNKLKETKDAYKLAYDNLTLEAISLFQAELNKEMDILNNEIYQGRKTSPTINIIDSNHYKFFTPKDGGTGSKYKGLVLFDLAVLSLTNLPVFVHDSVLLKQIEDYALEKILLLYTKTNAQVFIALDKGTSYTKKSQEILNENTILTLSPGGNELFGRAWNEVKQ